MKKEVREYLSQIGKRGGAKTKGVRSKARIEACKKAREIKAKKNA